MDRVPPPLERVVSPPPLPREERAAGVLRYVITDSPLGELLVAASERGLCRISFDPEPEQEVERLARSFGTRVLHTPGGLDGARSQLDAYFAGERTAFELALDVGRVPAFARVVLAELGRVAYGELTTYGALAGRAGRPKAARAVGTVMNRNPLPIVLPCHRVVGSTGKLVGYGGGLDRKEALLRLEGAIV